MTMQTDVKHAHAGSAGVMVPYPTRLKGVVMMPYQAVTEHTTFVDNFSITGTYSRTTTVATITAVNHGLKVRDMAYLDFAAGGPADDSYIVQTVIDANTFTVTVADSGNTSGAVVVWNDVLFHYDSTINVVTDIVIPGQGVRAEHGIRVFMPPEMHCSIFYG